MSLRFTDKSEIVILVRNYTIPNLSNKVVGHEENC